MTPMKQCLLDLADCYTYELPGTVSDNIHRICVEANWVMHKHYVGEVVAAHSHL